ncbi:Gag-pol polyprotein [Caligus rogercresseyi]|uniref:Gag-pol polyprotein n=1 Tax=Caligus rogercresseyi TaxID=217165 RepID=A0A7T8QTW5_CALRO|nr:Gag-pol polyprotein [Caligus rogercresseyi]
MGAAPVLAIGKHAFTLGDRISGRSFLVDTGAEVSVLPPEPNQRRQQPLSALLAANGTQIKCWGQKTIQLAFGPVGNQKHFSWRFHVADVSRPILGADFFAHFGLMIDLALRRVLTEDGKILPTALDRPAPRAVAGIHRDDHYSTLLSEFHDITVPNFRAPTVKHQVEHHVETTGPPVACRARRLDQQKLADAKREFKK